jgi:ribosomal protein S18 acetylase RimI-like enzyme
MRKEKMLIRVVKLEDIECNKLAIKKYLKEILNISINEGLEEKINEVLANMKKFIIDGTAKIIGAFNENEMIGFIWAYLIMKDTYHINYFCVDKTYRKIGVGQKLLDAIYDLANDQKIKKIELIVDSSNYEAIKKYEKNDFKKEKIKMIKCMEKK